MRLPNKGCFSPFFEAEILALVSGGRLTPVRDAAMLAFDSGVCGLPGFPFQKADILAMVCAERGIPNLDWQILVLVSAEGLRPLLAAISAALTWSGIF